MTTTQSHSSRSRYAFACMYSCLNPIAVRSPEQTTMSGSRSLISLIARSISPGTKCTSPQWMSETWAIFIAKVYGGSEDGLDRPVERGRDRGGGRNRQQPREDDVPGDPPADGREALRRTGSHHRAGDHVRGRDGKAEVRGDVDDRPARRLRREAA